MDSPSSSSTSVAFPSPTLAAGFLLPSSVRTLSSSSFSYVNLAAGFAPSARSLSSEGTTDGLVVPFAGSFAPREERGAKLLETL